VHGRVRRLALIRWAGFAAAVGGSLWGVKGTSIVLMGDQPEYIFEVAPLFLALGLGDSTPYSRDAAGGPARVGGALAWAGVALAGVSAAFYVPTTDDEAGPLSATIPLTALSIFAGLCSG